MSKPTDYGTDITLNRWRQPKCPKRELVKYMRVYL